VREIGKTYVILDAIRHNRVYLEIVKLLVHVQNILRQYLHD
jgi:hypothetical protein